jgi:aminotransferase
LIQSMLLVLQQSSRGPATFVQDAGAAALAGSQDCVAEMLAAYAARRAQVGEALGRWAMLPEGGFFAMADVRASGRESNETRKFLLEHHGVAVAHGSAYGAMGEGLLRVSFASGGDNLARGLQRLQAGLGAL